MPLCRSDWLLPNASVVWSTSGVPNGCMAGHLCANAAPGPAGELSTPPCKSSTGQREQQCARGGKPYHRPGAPERKESAFLVYTLTRLHQLLSSLPLTKRRLVWPTLLKGSASLDVLSQAALSRAVQCGAPSWTPARQQRCTLVRRSLLQPVIGRQPVKM
jgi:hypothetical protein